MAPHSSTLAWKIPWMEEPGGLQSMGSWRVGHDWATSLSIFTFHFHALEKEVATHSSVLAWRIPGMGKPGGLPSMGSHRVGHNWSDLTVTAAGSKKGRSKSVIPGQISRKDRLCSVVEKCGCTLSIKRTETHGNKMFFRRMINDIWGITDFYWAFLSC